MGIFVGLVVMLLVDVCKEWACELENVKLLVDSVEDCDVGLVMQTSGGTEPPPAAS